MIEPPAFRRLPGRRRTTTRWSKWLTASGECIGVAAPEPVPQVGAGPQGDASVDRGRARLASSSGASGDRARLRRWTLPVGDRGLAGLAHRDGQDQDETGAAPSPRPARGARRQPCRLIARKGAEEDFEIRARRAPACPRSEANASRRAEWLSKRGVRSPGVDGRRWTSPVAAPSLARKPAGPVRP